MPEAPRIRHGKLTDSEFQSFWSRGIPIVVTHVELQGTWDPQYFIREHGETEVTLVDCESEKTRKATLAEFFGRFGNPEERSKIEKLKVGFLVYHLSPSVLLR
jgi:lysine-specific demethylase 3